MYKDFHETLSAADWKALTRRLLYYADDLIRQCIWNGLPVTASPNGKVCVEGVGADDLVQEAVDRLLSGRRQFNSSVSLEQNLRGSIRSIVWSLNKSSRRHPVVITETTHCGPDTAPPLDAVADLAQSPDDAAMTKELGETQRQLLVEFEASLSGQDDLLTILYAIKDNKTKPREIEAATDISASRASELKRSLRTKLEQFQTCRMKTLQK